jgi:phosphatidylserine decarboxylase
MNTDFLISIVNTIRGQLSPINSEGYPFVGAFALATLILFWLWTPLGWIGLVLTIWCAYFFRDPPRVTPLSDGLVLAPADGKVHRVWTALPPTELGLSEQPMTCVTIFLNIFNCHINRSPTTGRVERIVYRSGAFINAELDKASEDNERNGFIITTAEGVRFGVVQIAGFIVSFVKEGGNVAVGERIGMIRFGSRVDLYLPEGVKPLVAEGQTMVAGETVIADLKLNDAVRTFRVA